MIKIKYDRLIQITKLGYHFLIKGKEYWLRHDDCEIDSNKIVHIKPEIAMEIGLV